MRRSLVAVVLAAGLATAAIPAVSSGAATKAHSLPAFYKVPSKWTHKPGALIKSSVVAVAGLNGTAYRVMYASQANKSKAVPVTGYVIVPNTAPPTGGYPVVAWDHGTNGMADVCAPSLAIGSSDISTAVINTFLAKGWAFVASDYQGEGTPGLMPYIVGNASAMDTINLVQAAAKITAAHTSTRWVDWGHSEGGQTAMFVDKLGGGIYGKGLHLLGVVAGAPPSQFGLLNSFLKTSPYAFYILMVAFGFNAYYGNTAANLGLVITPAAKAMLPLVAKPPNAGACTSALAAAVATYVGANNFAALQKADPYTVPAWKKLILANDPQSFKTKSTVPLLIIHGGADQQIPTVSSNILYGHLCSLGQTTQRWVYPGQSHAGVITPSFSDMTQWIQNRFNNVATPDTYVPIGMAGITTQTCN
jgi:fermentation-respiration switch protein FrsA (DUF1100 family)